MTIADPTAPRVETRGRPKGTPKDDWHIKIDQDVSLYFRMKLVDAFTGQMPKGEMSTLITRLLRDEMNRQLKGAKSEQNPAAEV